MSRQLPSQPSSRPRTGNRRRGRASRWAVGPGGRHGQAPWHRDRVVLHRLRVVAEVLAQQWRELDAQDYVAGRRPTAVSLLAPVNVQLARRGLPVVSVRTLRLDVHRLRSLASGRPAGGAI